MTVSVWHENGSPPFHPTKEKKRKWQPSQEGYGNFYVQIQEQIKLVFTINQDRRVVILAMLF